MESISFENKTILITGGYGFIMSNLINLLNETYYNITIITTRLYIYVILVTYITNSIVTPSICYKIVT